MTSDGNQIIHGGNIHIISFNKKVKLFLYFRLCFRWSTLEVHISRLKKPKRRVLYLPVINDPSVIYISVSAVLPSNCLFGFSFLMYELANKWSNKRKSTLAACRYLKYRIVYGRLLGRLNILPNSRHDDPTSIVA
jgi:hypothetical protein